jgi:hypothetical protein
MGEGCVHPTSGPAPPGDVSRERLGLEENVYARLSDEVDLVRGSADLIMHAVGYINDVFVLLLLLLFLWLLWLWLLLLLVRSCTRALW